MYAIRSYYVPPAVLVGLEQLRQGDTVRHHKRFVTNLFPVDFGRVVPDQPIQQLLDENNRITSYNVCYTKLLRLSAAYEKVDSAVIVAYKALLTALSFFGAVQV